MHQCQPHTLENLLSKPRLATYMKYFHTRSHDEVLGIYLWNGALAVNFSTLLGYFEIALRNKIHQSLSLALTSQTRQSIHWYDTLTLDPENQAKVDKIRFRGKGPSRTPRNPPPSPDEVVSRLSFGFWPHALTTLGRLYGTVMPVIFPNHALSVAIPSPGWADKKTRRAALAYLYELNDFRNRIAHHEPIWKFAAIMDTSVTPARVVVPASRSFADSLARLQRILMHVDHALMALDQDYYLSLRRSECRETIDRLLTLEGFNRYRFFRNAPAVEMTPAAFRKKYHLIVRGNRPVRIRLGDKKGVFVPD